MYHLHHSQASIHNSTGNWSSGKSNFDRAYYSILNIFITLKTSSTINMTTSRIYLSSFLAYKLNSLRLLDFGQHQLELLELHIH